MPGHRSIAALSVFGRAGERADRNDSRVFSRSIGSSTARIIMQLPKVIRSHLLSQSALQQQFGRGFDARRGVRGHHSVRKDTLLTPDELLQALAFHLVRAPRFRRSAFDVALGRSKPGAAQSELRDEIRRVRSSLTSKARGRVTLLRLRKAGTAFSA
jgi:hypothetical protein